MNERNRQLLAHLAFAVANHEKKARLAGLPIPPALPFIAEFLTDVATRRQDATQGEDGEVLVDAESMTSQPALVLKKQEAAVALRVSVRTLERLIASGALSVVSVGGSPRVRRTDLDAYIASLAGPAKFQDSIESKEPA